MANMNINGVSTGGSVYQLNSLNQLEPLKQSIKNDGRDQLIVKAENKIYIIESDHLHLKGMRKGVVGKPSEYNLQVNGQKIKTELLNVDDEVNSASDGFAKVAKAVGLAFGGFVISEGLFQAITGKTMVSATPRNSAIILGVIGLAVAGGMVYGATREQTRENPLGALGQKIN